jgi:16S rRNA (cytosine967-C5)-methyltransferase
VLGVLRWRRSLDELLADHLRTAVDRLDAEVLVALRIGLFEGAQMGVPSAVATDGAVHLVRRLGRTSAGGLVNAVLRRALPAWPEKMAGAAPDLRLSHPEWLARRWAEHFGVEAAEHAMEAAQQPAPVWVWFLEDSARTELAERGVELRSHPWCPGAWTVDGAAGELLREVSRGRAYVQDPSSQLVAHLAGRLAGDGGRIADLCAAPGGKAALTARLRPGHRLVAMDIRPRRVSMMRPLLQRVGVDGCVVADAGVPPLPPRGVDLVLLDAPCSGTGTFRRHPELKWRLRAESIEERAREQTRLLRSTLELVSPAGTLLYATCSIEPEENEGLGALGAEGFGAVELSELLPGGVPAERTVAGGIRILPNLDGDGFTMHALRRVSG